VRNPTGKFDVTWLPRRRGVSQADPFGLVKDDRIFILCEQLDSNGKGKIVCYEEARDHSFSECYAALELPYHVSYPYLVESEGQIYCVPETNQAHEIALYRASEFPRSWEKTATLIEDFRGVDPTLFKFNDKWWLACANEDDEPWRKLYLWHSEELTGPWEPHNANPVKTALASSRPAGTPFIFEGDLYRPAQDCSGSYGRRVVINRVKRLTTEQFQEEESATLDPLSPLYANGFHTLSSVGQSTLIDGRRLRMVSSFREARRNWAGQRRSLRRRLNYTDEKR